MRFILLLGAFIISCNPSVYVSHIDNYKVVNVDGQEIVLDTTTYSKHIFLVRHAEKDSILKDDPGLTAAGEARARALMKIFKKMRVDRIYSTMYSRTLLTASDLSNDKGVEILPYDPRDLEGFSQTLKEEDFSSILVVGHSNTTPTLANLLMGNEELANFSEDDYDNLLLVNLGENDSKLIQMKFKPETE